MGRVETQGSSSDARPNQLGILVLRELKAGAGVLLEVWRAVRRKRFMSGDDVYPPASDRVERCKPSHQPWTVSFSSDPALAYDEKTHAILRRGSAIAGMVEASGGLAEDAVAVLGTQLWVPPRRAMVIDEDHPLLAAYLSPYDFTHSCDLAKMAWEAERPYIVLPSAIRFNATPRAIEYNVHVLAGRPRQPPLADLPSPSSYTLTTYTPNALARLTM